MDAKELEAIFNEARPGIVEQLKQEFTKTISWDAKQKLVNLVTAHVEEWVKKEILPEITDQLIKDKDGLVTLGKSLGPEIVKGITAALSLEINEKLKDSYKRGEFFKAMFGRGY